ncbi:MAG: hypothetical protein ABII08_04710 [Candidatus Beckwithbacteria bacterium]|nr:hypothetical protein [Patescibacteria group bacterium]
MNSIPLNQLVKIAPLDQASKDKILTQLPTLSDTQKFEISKTLWNSISLTFQSFVKEKQQAMLDEMASGKAVYEKKDFQNAENEIFNKLLVKIDETQSAEEVKTLKSQLLHEGS